jgi:4-aminobutyrate aminotransferase-like enzyme
MSKVVNKQDLVDRRERLLSPTYYHFFDEMMHLVKGEGVWVWDAEGNKYLDCYNNVPSVGHCHPDIIEALIKQASAINVSTRYLHEAVVEYADILTSKLPDHLNNCVFACTGTEANDLAIQMARQITGNHGVLVSDFAYHGNSDLVTKLSPQSYPITERPDWLAVFDVPDPYRGVFADKEPETFELYLEQACKQLDQMEERGHKLAALLVDCSFENVGLAKIPEGYLSVLCDEVRRRGGLIIADEVQSGYCRMGTHWWGFLHHGIQPDMVTCGKGMGAGQPISVMVCNYDHAKKFSRKYDYFNTTAGNPVSSSVGKAVIDVIDREGLLQVVTDSGHYLSEKLFQLKERHEIIGAVRGSGMFQGLDLVSDPTNRTPITPDQMRHLGTLIAKEGVITGTSGRYGNLLKIRPPLPAQREHVDIAVSAIDRVLANF